MSDSEILNQPHPQVCKFPIAHFNVLIILSQSLTETVDLLPKVKTWDPKEVEAAKDRHLVHRQALPVLVNR